MRQLHWETVTAEYIALFSLLDTWHMTHNGINYPRIIEARCAGDKCWASFPSRSRCLFFPCVVSWLTRAWERRRAGHQWRRPGVTRGQCSVVTRQPPQHQPSTDNGAMVTRNIITLLLVRLNTRDTWPIVWCGEFKIKTRVNLMKKWSKTASDEISLINC